MRQFEADDLMRAIRGLHLVTLLENLTGLVNKLVSIPQTRMALSVLVFLESLFGDFFLGKQATGASDTLDAVRSVTLERLRKVHVDIHSCFRTLELFGVFFKSRCDHVRVMLVSNCHVLVRIVLEVQSDLRTGTHATTRFRKVCCHRCLL